MYQASGPVTLSALLPELRIAFTPCKIFVASSGQSIACMVTEYSKTPHFRHGRKHRGQIASERPCDNKLSGINLLYSFGLSMVNASHSEL